MIKRSTVFVLVMLFAFLCGCSVIEQPDGSPSILESLPTQSTQPSVEGTDGTASSATQGEPGIFSYAVQTEVVGDFSEAYTGEMGIYKVIRSAEELLHYLYEELGLEETPLYADAYDKAFFEENLLIVGTYSKDPEIVSDPQKNYHLPVEILDVERMDDGSFHIQVGHYPPVYSYDWAPERTNKIFWIEINGSDCNGAPVNVEIIELEENPDQKLEELERA